MKKEPKSEPLNFRLGSCLPVLYSLSHEGQACRKKHTGFPDIRAKNALATPVSEEVVLGKPFIRHVRLHDSMCVWLRPQHAATCIARGSSPTAVPPSLPRASVELFSTLWMVARKRHRPPGKLGRVVYTELYCRSCLRNANLSPPTSPRLPNACFRLRLHNERTVGLQTRATLKLSGGGVLVDC
jgi:hypothetical protein